MDVAGDLLVWIAVVCFGIFITMMMWEVLWVNILLYREQKISASLIEGWEQESRRLENATFQWEFPDPPEISND